MATKTKHVAVDVKTTKEVLVRQAKRTQRVLSGFRDFALRGNAIELAVGVVIGGAFTALVNALVNSVLNPLVAALFGSKNMDGVWIIELNGSALHFGTFLSATINFLTIAATLYFFIILPLNKLMELTSKKNGRKSLAEPTSEKEPETQEELLKAILQQLKNKK